MDVFVHDENSADEALRSTFAELADLSHRGVARALNERGIKTAQGAAWTAMQVARVRRGLPRVRRTDGLG